MVRKVRPIVSAGVKMKFVRDFLGNEELMERLRSHVESELIAGSAVEINLQAHGTTAIPSESKWIIAIPVFAVERYPKGGTHQPRQSFFLRAGSVYFFG